MKKAENNDVDCMLCFFRQEAEKGQETVKRENGESTRMETGGEICFVVPGVFVKNRKEDTAHKYLYECRPEILYQEMAGKCDFLFQTVDRQSGKLEECLEAAKRALRCNDEKIIWYGSGEADAGTGRAGWFEFKSFAESEEIYNMIFMAETETQRVYGAFHCIFEEYDKWKPIVIRMLENMQTGGKKNEGILD